MQFLIVLLLHIPIFQPIQLDDTSFHNVQLFSLAKSQEKCGGKKKSVQDSLGGAQWLNYSCGKDDSIQQDSFSL